MFLIVFSIILILANIYCFLNKKYLYLFFPCMLFLPEYYGLDITGSFPIITVSRIMFIIFYIYAFLNRKASISTQKRNNTFPKATLFLWGYFFFRIVSNIYYIPTYSQATKTIFSIVFEQLGLLVALYLLQPDREEIFKTIKSVVYAATVLFTVGILESYTYFRPFDALYTVHREMNNLRQVRLGLLRATTTLGLPVIYGNMCIIILPLILYLYSCTREKKYLGILLLDLLATIHSGSRADIMFFAAIIGFYFIIRLILKTDIVLFLKNAVVISVLAAIIIISLSFSNQYSRYFYEGTVKSVLNEFGFSFNLEESAPEGVAGFGTNKNGVSSRTFQFTGIQYAFNKNPVFGLGTGALANGDVYYNGWGEWVVYYTYDMGIVEILISEGIMGFLGYSSLFIFLAILLLTQLSMLQNDKPLAALAILPFTYLLTTLSTANMQSFLFFIIIIIVFLPKECVQKNP